MKKRSRIYRRHAGQGMVEYALLLSLIALAVIGIIAVASGAVGQAFNNVTDSVAPEKPLVDTTPTVPPNTLPPFKLPGAKAPDTTAWTASGDAVYVVAYVPMFADASLA